MLMPWGSTFSVIAKLQCAGVGTLTQLLVI